MKDYAEMSLDELRVEQKTLEMFIEQALSRQTDFGGVVIHPGEGLTFEAIDNWVASYEGDKDERTLLSRHPAFGANVRWVLAIDPDMLLENERDALTKAGYWPLKNQIVSRYQHWLNRGYPTAPSLVTDGSEFAFFLRNTAFPNSIGLAVPEIEEAESLAEAGALLLNELTAYAGQLIDPS